VSRSVEALPLLLKKTGLWRASHLDCEYPQGTSTGYEQLDQHLPGAGWPTAGITELLFDQPGIGELRLLTPALAHLSQQQSRWQLWISPPYLPYAPALAQAGIDLGAVLIVRPTTANDSLWVMEQALGSQSCSAVLAWPQSINDKQIRRLQVASKAGHCLGVLFRHNHAAHHSSPAELRLQLTAQSVIPLKEHSSIGVQVLKRRGGWASRVFTVDFHDQLNQVTPDFSEMIIRNSPPSKPELAFIEQTQLLFSDEHQQQ
jgi:cell division inhibitor SulA